KVTSIQKKDRYYKIKTAKNLEFKCKILIGADGPHSKIREVLLFPEPKEFLMGVGAEITNTNLNPDFVEIFVGNKIAPGFFAWIIPTNKDGTNARIGLCTSKKAKYSVKYYFNKLLENKHFQPYIKNCEITRLIGGVIPLGVLKKTYDDNVMLVGDAAAQVKPTSGGGLYPGLLCANICSRVAIEALQKNDFTSNVLKKYQKQWEKEIGSELKKGMRYRALFKKVTDKRIDKYIEKLQNPEIIEIINEYGDIDFPSKLVKPLIKKSRFFI
ncbi:MAG TPA: NAD(P)/FAD-dependent oxidoreductase, partial [Bacteroidetes bacterium]|nr:NAD(P)/FAD-dependent oxidoreductase [Bacteroidota bacterium]